MPANGRLAAISRTWCVIKKISDLENHLALYMDFHSWVLIRGWTTFRTGFGQKISDFSVTSLCSFCRPCIFLLRCQKFKVSLSTELNNDLEKARLAYQQNPRVLRNLDYISECSPNQPPTELIVFKMFQYLMKDQMRMSSNDWRDAAHTIVPLAYCDFLVLDGTWAAIAGQISGPLRQNGAETARVFSMQNLEEFFDAFEGIQTENQSVSQRYFGASTGR